MANTDVSILAAELFVNDKKAAAAILEFYSKLEKTNADINKIGDKATFGDKLVSEFERTEKSAKQTQSKIAELFSPENIVKGATFGAALKFLNDSISAAYAAEKANRLLSASATEAGKSYLDLANANAEFAKSASLSRVEAASTTAKIQQLATFAGRPQDLEKLQKSFLDLSAARGIGGGELQDLIGTILSGQDEGLNRLGLADPSKLQATYAASIGKTVDALSQQEKVQAAVNAIMEKAAVFTGANADRLESLSGQTQSANSKLGDLYTTFGQGITGSLEFRDAVKLANGLLENLSINLDTIQGKLKQGLSPKEIANSEAHKPGAQILDAIKDFTGGIVAVNPLVQLYDTLTVGGEDAARRFYASFGGAQGRRIAELARLIEGEQKGIDNQNKAAHDQAQKTVKTYDDLINEQITGLTKSKDKIAALAKLKSDFAKDVAGGLLSDSGKEKFQTQINELSGKIDVDQLDKQVDRLIKNNATLDKLREKRDELAKLKPFATTEDFQTTDNKIADFIVKSTEEAKKKIEELSKQAFDVFEGIAAKISGDNPFVKVLNDYDDGIKKIRENTRGLKSETREWLEALLSRQRDVDLFSTRLESALSADNLRDEARTFRNGKSFKIENPGEFFAAYLEAGIKELTKSKGYVEKYARDETFGGFMRVQNRPGIGYERTANGGFIQVDEVANFGKVFERLGSGGFINRAKTFDDLTQADKQKYIDSLSKTPDDENLQSRLDRQILIIQGLQRGAYSSDPEKNLQINTLADKKLIALTQGIDPGRLNNQEREAAAAAREREAARQETAEKESKEIERSKKIALEKIQTDLSTLTGIAQTQGLGGIVRIIDESKNATTQTVKSPTSDDAAAQYRQNLPTRVGGGLKNF